MLESIFSQATLLCLSRATERWCLAFATASTTPFNEQRWLLKTCSAEAPLRPRALPHRNEAVMLQKCRSLVIGVSTETGLGIFEWCGFMFVSTYCFLTIELSGRTPADLPRETRPTMNNGPLERGVRCHHYHLIAPRLCFSTPAALHARLMIRPASL
jgi:hypothetical protein